MFRARVYVAGPYTIGDVEYNVREAIRAASELADHGFAPFVPHLTHYWDKLFPRPYEFWLALDFEYMLVACDAILRIPGMSEGADRETAQAREWGIPVLYTIGEVVEYFTKREKSAETDTVHT